MFISKNKRGETVRSITSDVTYSIWRAMKQRLFDDNDVSNKWYSGKGMCEEWFEFRNFYNWYYDNMPANKNYRYVLDKDILSNHKGGYSPENCALIPNHLNMAFMVPSTRGASTLKTGVTETPKGRYVARCTEFIDGKSIRTYLGTFSDEESAYQVYKLRKEEYLRQESERLYKDGAVDVRVYKALSCFDWDDIEKLKRSNIII